MVMGHSTAGGAQRGMTVTEMTGMGTKLQIMIEISLQGTTEPMRHGNRV